jgi:hypothetical protein
MKNINKVLLGCVTVVSFLCTSCQDTLKEQFFNPESYEAPSNKLGPGLFSQTLYSWQIYVQDYGEWWWALTGYNITAYAQVGVRVPVANYAGIYDYLPDLNETTPADNNIGNYFGNMYPKVNSWSILKGLIEKDFKGQVLDDNLPYFQLVSVIKDFVILRNIDYYNSVPYSQALLGKEAVLFPKFDDPKEATRAMLLDLKSISSSLEANYNKMSAEAKTEFAIQDLAFKGDIKKWVKYTNALCLKYAVRMSGVDEAFAKEQIQSAIAGGLPAADCTWELPFSQSADLPGGGTVVRGRFERFTSFFIPNVILERMNHQGYAYTPGVDDPRLPFIAAPTRYNDYRGIRLDKTYNQPLWDAIVNQDDANKPAGMSALEWTRTKRFIMNNSGDRDSKGDLGSFTYNCVSMYNPATYIYNDFPVSMMTLGEVDLLLAEVAAKNLASTGKTAGAHLADAVTHSTAFWYYVSTKSTAKCSVGDIKRFRPDNPAAADVQTYANYINTEYGKLGDVESRMEMIMQQKYIHLNLMDPNECWTELRRTRHPKLEPINFPPTYTNGKPVIERIMYPSSEETVNSENFLVVKPENNYTSPIYWVPTAKRAESYYGDTFIPIE